MYVKFMSPPGQGRVKAWCIMYQGCGHFALSARLRTAEMSSLCVGGFAVGQLRPISVSSCKTNSGCNSKRVVLSARLTSGPPSSPAPTHHPPTRLPTTLPSSRLVSCFIHPPQRRDYLSPEVRSVFRRQPHPSRSQTEGISSKGNPVLFPSQFCSVATFDKCAKVERQVDPNLFEKKKKEEKNKKTGLRKQERGIERQKWGSSNAELLSRGGSFIEIKGG